MSVLEKIVAKKTCTWWRGEREKQKKTQKKLWKRNIRIEPTAVVAENEEGA